MIYLGIADLTSYGTNKDWWKQIKQWKVFFAQIMNKFLMLFLGLLNQLINQNEELRAEPVEKKSEDDDEAEDER